MNTNETPIITGRPRRAYTLKDWSDALDHSERLRELARHAEQLGLESQTDSIHREADEYEREAEMIQMDLISRGIEP
jgi:predicted nucleotidyltransferase